MSLSDAVWARTLALPEDLQRVVFEQKVAGTHSCHELVDLCTGIVPTDGVRRAYSDAPGCDAREAYLQMFGGPDDPTFKWLYQGRVTWTDFERRCNGTDFIVSDWHNHSTDDRGEYTHVDGVFASRRNPQGELEMRSGYCITFRSPSGVLVSYNGVADVVVGPTQARVAVRGWHRFLYHGWTNWDLRIAGADDDAHDNPLEMRLLPRTRRALDTVIGPGLAAADDAGRRASLLSQLYDEIFISTCAEFMRSSRRPHAAADDPRDPGFAFLRDPALDPGIPDLATFLERITMDVD